MKNTYTTEQILEALRDVDWTEEMNDSGWEALNRIVHLIDGDEEEE